MVATSALADRKPPGSSLGLTHIDVRSYKKQHHGNSKDTEQDRARKEVWSQQVFYEILVPVPER